MKPAIILFYFALAAATVSSVLFYSFQDEYRNTEIIPGENMNINLDTAVEVADTATKRLAYTWVLPNDDTVRDSAPKSKDDEDFSFPEDPLSTPLGLAIIIVSSILMVGAIVLACTYRKEPARLSEEGKTVPLGAAEDDTTKKERSESEEKESSEESTGDSHAV